MALRLFVNPTEAPINAKAATPVDRLGVRDVDVTAAELATAIDAGLLAGTSRYANRILAGAANGRVLVRSAVKEGKEGRDARVAIVVDPGTVARSIAVAGKDVTINVATTGGAVNASETATNIAAAINANGAAAALVTAAVAETDTGAGLVAADALAALGPAAPALILDKNNRKLAGELLAHSL